jgi:hypothetical protein
MAARHPAPIDIYHSKMEGRVMGHKSLRDIWFDVDEANAVLAGNADADALQILNAPLHSFDWATVMARAFEADDVYAEIPAIIAQRHSKREGRVMAHYDGTAKPRVRAERDALERLQKGPRVGFFDVEAAREQMVARRRELRGSSRVNHLAQLGDHKAEAVAGAVRVGPLGFVCLTFGKLKRAVRHVFIKGVGADDV